MSIEELPVDQIDPSPSNPRKTIRPGYLEELAASIRDKGIVSPILVRPRTDKGWARWEIVFGECRWRASQLAGVERIPAMVRELDDREVLEIQIIENDRREDVDPVEQSAAYRRLVDEYEYTAEDLAAKTGRSLTYVRQRLQLVQLGKIGRVALEQGKITLGVALLISRLTPEQQTKALEELLPDDEDPGPYVRDVATLRQARKVVRDRIVRRLDTAPFSLSDISFPQGACLKCPKRTTTQAGLFDLGDEDDLCTDPTCFASKVDAHWATLRADPTVQTLPEEQAEKVFYPNSDMPSYASGYVRAGDIDPKNGSRARDIAPDAVVLARSPGGTIVELVPRSALPQETDAKKRAKKVEDAADRERKLEQAVSKALARAVAEAARGVTPAKLRAVAEGAWRALAGLATWQLEEIAERRGLYRQDLPAGRAGRPASDTRAALLGAPWSLSLLAESVCTLLDSQREEVALDALCGALEVSRAVVARQTKKAFETGKEKAKTKAKAKDERAKPKTTKKRQLSIAGA